MRADALPPLRAPGEEWGIPIVLALLVHVLTALVFALAWWWSPVRKTDAASGNALMEASLQLSAAESAAASGALRDSAGLPQPVPEAIAPPQSLPESRPQTAITPPQYNAQERIVEPDAINQDAVSAMSDSPEQGAKEQEEKRIQGQIDLTEGRKRQEEVEQKQRLAQQQAEAERQQKIEDIRRQREAAQRQVARAEQSAQRASNALNNLQSSSPTAGTASNATASGTAAGSGAQSVPGQGGNSDDLTARYYAAIQQAVQAQWVRPESVPLGVTCTVNIRQLPGGEVFEAKAAADCPYDEAGKRSVEAAVLKAQPLPYNGFQTVFQRNLPINFIYKGDGR